MLRRLFIVLLLAVTLSGDTIQAQDKSPVINLVTFLDTGNFNPLFSLNTLIQRLTYDTLYRVDGNTALPSQGSGLTTWTVSEDGLTYTFTIREDAFWSDGEPITTRDIQFTLNAVASPEVQSWYYGYLPREMFTGFTVDSLIVVD